MKKNERGAALIVIMAGMSLILLVLLTGLAMTSMSGKTLKRQLTYQGQAMNAASAGLTESLSWYRRQSVQPVVNFAPILDVGGVCLHFPLHTPPVNDTEDPAIGIVREYDLSAQGRLKGRYEVRRTAVQDMTAERGKGLVDDGTVWHLVSDGAIYVDNDNTVAYNVAPNVVLARRQMLTEIQRLRIQPPASAAVFVARGDRMNVNASVRLRGLGATSGLAWPSATGNPVIPAGVLSGNPTTTLTNVAFDIPAVFGLTRQELLATADIVSDSVANLPPTMPAMGLVVINGNATFTPARRLNGSGVLVVIGNLVIQQNTLSQYSGLIYVEGTVNIAEPVTISGALIVAPPAATAGTWLTLAGGADTVEISWDNAIMTQIRQQMGQYRYIRSFYMPPGR